MPQADQPLTLFQEAITGKGQAKIDAVVVDEIFGSISVLDDIDSAKLARKTDVHKMTANRYVRGEASPRLNVAVRMLEKLGYDLYLVKKQ